MALVLLLRASSINRHVLEGVSACPRGFQEAGPCCFRLVIREHRYFHFQPATLVLLFPAENKTLDLVHFTFSSQFEKHLD